MSSILKAENIRYQYSSQTLALDGASVNLQAGQVLSIVGPNGSGKSTLIKIAAGVLKPDSGKVRLNNKDISSLTRIDIAKTLGYLPQTTDSVFNHRVEEIVAMGRFVHLRGLGFLTADDRKKIEKSMAFTEVLQYRHRTLAQLSGGEKQRVLLASVLCQEPDLLLLDEPSAGLDLHHQIAFSSLLQKLSREGMAVAVVTHDLNIASMYSDQILLLSHGKVIKTGKPQEVINQQYLGQVYPDNIFVEPHPITGHPMVLPMIQSQKGQP